MKATLKILCLLILMVSSGVIGYLKLILPDVGAAPQIKVAITPERIAHGRYPANHVAACMDWHSTRNRSKLSAPFAPGSLGKGCEYLGPKMGFPGKYYSKNLTPTHLDGWSGKALFLVMPYSYYAQMDKEDVLNIIAYIRSPTAIENRVPASSPDFPMNFTINTIPHKHAFSQKPAKENTVLYGKCLVTTAACMDCHSPVSKGKVNTEKALSGGRAFELSVALYARPILHQIRRLVSATGQKICLSLSLKHINSPKNLVSAKPGDYNTLMPWSMYAGMDTTELKKTYAYLKSLPPIHNSVTKYTAR